MTLTVKFIPLFTLDGPRYDKWSVDSLGVHVQPGPCSAEMPNLASNFWSKYFLQRQCLADGVLWQVCQQLQVKTTMKSS